MGRQWLGPSPLSLRPGGQRAAAPLPSSKHKTGGKGGSAPASRRLPASSCSCLYVDTDGYQATGPLPVSVGQMWEERGVTPRHENFMKFKFQCSQVRLYWNTARAFVHVRGKAASAGQWEG